MLPDVALLNIFDLYMEEELIDPLDNIYDSEPRIEVWRTLAHVCRKWRYIVFGSPRRLKLRVYCRRNTPAREMLDIWPNFPVIVWVTGSLDIDNTIDALKHNDRVCAIYLWDVRNSVSEKILVAMKQPLPALTRLVLGFEDETALVHPASFLGGSAQGLQLLILRHIPFPGLPTLLLSATHLVNLYVWRIPHSGYFSPDAIVSVLSVLTRLEALAIDFISPRSRPTRKSRRSLLTRPLLPVLAHLHFRGVSEYLEDLVARIDAPLLDSLRIFLYHKLIFDAPQLNQLVSRTPKFKVLNEARVTFGSRSASVKLQSTSGAKLFFNISIKQPDWQLLSLARLCRSLFFQALIPVERLYIRVLRPLSLPWQDGSSQWLELLHLFTSVKDLYISSNFTPRITSVLQELVGERVTEVLPSLQALFLSKPHTEPVPDAIGQFIAVRQLSGHPIAVSRWDDEDDEDDED